MVRYELRAQHRPPATGGDVQVWHIVPRGRAVTLCHKPLDVVGDARPLADLRELPVLTWCHRCVAAYRHLVATPLPWDEGTGRRGGRGAWTRPSWPSRRGP